MPNTIIPSIAHAVRHQIHREHELSLYIERAKAEKAVSFFGGVLIDLVDRAEHEQIVEELKLKLADAERRNALLIDAMDRLAWHGHLQTSTCASDEVNADLRFAADVLVQVKQPLKEV